jgi:hypothetical protein
MRQRSRERLGRGRGEGKRWGTKKGIEARNSKEKSMYYRDKGGGEGEKGR